MQQDSNHRTSGRVSHDMIWDIQRYLLGDESIDGAAMEARMLDDPEFALLVADELQGLQDVCELAGQPAVELVASPSKGPSDARRSLYISLAMCAVAASLLCFLYLKQHPPLPGATTSETDHTVVVDPALQAIAERWVTLDFQDDEWGLPEWESEPSYILYGFGETVAGEPVADDWMMNASDFFREADI